MVIFFEPPKVQNFLSQVKVASYLPLSITSLGIKGDMVWGCALTIYKGIATRSCKGNLKFTLNGLTNDYFCLLLATLNYKMTLRLSWHDL